MALMGFSQLPLAISQPLSWEEGKGWDNNEEFLKKKRSTVRPTIDRHLN